MIWLAQQDILGTRELAIVAAIYFNMDKNNLVNKGKVKKVPLARMDIRTFNKHWNALEEKQVIKHLDKKIWMLSPDYAFKDGVSRDYLVQLWKGEVQHGAI